MAAKEVEIAPPEHAEKKSRAIAKREGGGIALAQRTPDINDLMAQAVATGNMDTIERVFALRTQLKQEAAREAFYAALSAFQNECPVIKKTKVVPFKGGTGVMYRYAPLDTIIKKVGPLLTRHGLSYTIKAGVELMDGGMPFMVATLSIQHSAGYSDQSEFRVPLDKEAINASHMNDAQRYGSASTYAKRNVFLNGFGIMCGDEDDDGAGAGPYTPQQAKEARETVRQPQAKPTAQKANGAKVKVDLEPAAAGEQIDAATVTGLAKAMTNATLSNDDFTKRFSKLSGLEQVKKSDARAVMSWIADPTRN